MALGGVLGLDRLQFLGRVLAEQVLEEVVEVGAVLHRASAVRPSYRMGRWRRPPRPADGVAVDEVAEDLVRALLVAHQDGRAGEADARAVGQPGQQVACRSLAWPRWASSTSTKIEPSRPAPSRWAAGGTPA